MFSRLAIVVALVVVTLPSCRRDSDALAWLERKEGTVDRDFAGRVGSWVIAEPKAAFRVGDGVRTGADSTARLELSDKSKLSLEASTVVRFLARPPGQSSQRLDVETGDAVIEVGSESLRLDTVIGSATLEPFTNARLSRTENGLRFAVAIGAARIEAEGQQVPVAKGETKEFTVPGKPRATPAAVESASPADAPTAAPSASAAPVAIDMSGAIRGPDVFDFVAGAGDSMVVHDPHPPTVVALARPESCAGPFVVDVGGGRTPRRISGDKTANLELMGGQHPYSVRCAKDDGTLDKAIARGNLTVLADAGTRRLPTSAPSTLVDTDGRKYTVLYQNLLPSITLRWAGAPGGSAFTVHENSTHGSHSFSSAAPTFTFAPGSLGEGAHDLSFESGGRLSKVTTVTIRFDNAAPTASLSSPPPAGFAPDGAVSVNGTALPGWVVTVGGTELSQDDQHRFAGQVTAPSGQRALLIRFSNPQRGVQYYLRRAAH
jgi:hypothetical protein